MSLARCRGRLSREDQGSSWSFGRTNDGGGLQDSVSATLMEPVTQMIPAVYAYLCYRRRVTNNSTALGKTAAESANRSLALGGEPISRKHASVDRTRLVDVIDFIWTNLAWQPDRSHSMGIANVASGCSREGNKPSISAALGRKTGPLKRRLVKWSRLQNVT